MQWEKLDKTVFSVSDLDNPPDDRAYWLSRPPEERLAAMEFLRQMVYGYDPATARVERVLEIVELE